MSKSKGKSKSKHPTVRGPQGELPLGKDGKPRTPVAGTRDGHAPSRRRYVEPPAKKYGNPFIAVRIPRELHAAFLKQCAKRKVTKEGVIRAYLAKWTGVKLSEVGSDE